MHSVGWEGKMGSYGDDAPPEMTIFLICIIVQYPQFYHSNSGANPASYPVGTRVKAARAWSWPHTFV
jgi:hypothetical protein